MTLDEQIKYTEEELTAYRENKYSSPKIVKWLESILDSLLRLKSLEK
jgi:hypothetical protein